MLPRTLIYPLLLILAGIALLLIGYHVLVLRVKHSGNLVVLNYDRKILGTHSSLSSPIQFCSTDEAVAYGAKYAELYKNSNTWSACYTDAYMIYFYLAELGLSSNRNKLFFDIGANKGYTIAGWLSLWMPNRNISTRNLGKFLQTELRISDCGACSDCKGEQAYFCTSRYFSVLLGTSRYFSVLLGTSRYFSVLLGTSWYFVILLRTSSYFSVLPGTSSYFSVLLGTSWYFLVLRHTSADFDP